MRGKWIDVHGRAGALDFRTIAVTKQFVVARRDAERITADRRLSWIDESVVVEQEHALSCRQ